MSLARSRVVVVLLSVFALVCPQCTGARATAEQGGLTGEPVHGSVLFSYSVGGKRTCFPLSRDISAYLEERSSARAHDSEIGNLPLVRSPMGYFVIRGREYAWAGYAAMEPRENPERREVRLAPCFNLPVDTYFKVDSLLTAGEEQASDGHTLEQLYRDFFSEVSRALSR